MTRLFLFGNTAVVMLNLLAQKKFWVIAMAWFLSGSCQEVQENFVCVSTSNDSHFSYFVCNRKFMGRKEKFESSNMHSTLKKKINF